MKIAPQYRQDQLREELDQAAVYWNTGLKSGLHVYH